MEIDITERVSGVLLGLAAGDRNGGPIRLALRLARSLLERGEFNVRDIGRRYLEWWLEGAFDTGPVAGLVLQLVASGMSWEEAVQEVHVQMRRRTGGCNPAHRSSPLAMAGFLEDERLAACALSEAKLTHADPIAGDVAAAVVMLCRALIRGIPWKVSLELAAEKRDPRTQEALCPLEAKKLGRGGFAPEALAAAIHFVETHDGFIEALRASIEFAGPANYCPVLVGAIAGARWGASAIPPSSLGHCEILAQVLDTANRLLGTWILTP